MQLHVVVKINLRLQQLVYRTVKEPHPDLYHCLIILFYISWMKFGNRE
jgi:hypothetical protein